MSRLSCYLSFVRFSHTIFALPFAMASLLLASRGLPQWDVFCLVLLCMIGARTAAMAFNRIVDQKMDAANPRTTGRHLPAGLLSSKEAWGIFFLGSLIFLTAAFFLNHMSAVLALPVLLFLLGYSYMKRFTWLCHLYLGVALGLSPLGAWVAARGELAWPAAWLALLLLLWVAGFDMIYATQDEEFDRSAGLHSAAARFGRRGSLHLAAFFHLVLVIILWCGFFFEIFSLPWFMSCSVVTALVFFIHFLRKSDSLDDMNRDFFLANALLSCVVLAGIWLESTN